MTVTEIIAKWPSDAEFAADLGISLNSLRVWRHRQCIPVKHWDGVISAAKRRHMKGVTLEVVYAASKGGVA